MTTKAIHRFLILISLAVYSIVIADTYISPWKNDTEVIKSNWVTSGSKYGNSYLIATDKRTYTLTPSVYDDASIGDTVTVMRSLLCNVVQEISIKDSGYMYPLGYSTMKTAQGIILTLLFVTLILAAFFAYDYIPTGELKVAATIAALVFSIATFLIYIFS